MSEALQVNPPPYQQIADRYRNLIGIGRFKAGDRLPPITQIAIDFKVSPRTANKALKLLAVEGLIVTTQQGSRVADGPSVRMPKESVAPRSFVPESTDRVRVTSASKVETPEIVHGTLATEDEEVLRREAITERDGRPHTFSVCWIPVVFEGRFPQLLEEEHIPALLSLIAPPDLDEVPGQDWVTARVIETEREAEALDLAIGETTLAGASIWTAKGSPLLYREWMSPAGEQVTYEYVQKTR